MIQNLRLYLLRLLDIRNDDLRRTLLMQAYLFIIISVLLFLKPVSNSIFLSNFGIGQIPYVFIAVSIAAFLFTKLYIRLQGKLTFIKLHRSILTGILISLILFFVGIQIDIISGFFIYAFYIWVAIFALVATSQFWIFANILFNPREARRVFGIIGAGGIAGGVFGGYLTSLVVPFIGNSGMILLSAIFILICFPLVHLLWQEQHAGASEDSLLVRKRRKIGQKFSVRRLYKSRHLLLLAFLTGIGVLVSKLVDFQFQGIASATYSDSEQLTSFFGFWFSTFNVLGLIIQLFFTSRLLKFLGVSKSQFILPGAFVISGILLILFPVLWCAILIKGADGTIKQSVQRSVQELLMLPIPKEIKEQSKTFIDVFIDSLATGLSGIILIFLLSISSITSTIVSILIVALSIVWIALASEMKKEYFKSFKQKFLSNTSDVYTNIDQQNTVYRKLESLLEAKDERDLLNVLGNLERLPKGLDYHKMLSLLDHPNPDIRYKALQLRPFPNKKFKPQILDLLRNDPELKVRLETYLYLLERESNISEAELSQELENFNKTDDPAILFAACIYFRNNQRIKERFSLEQKLEETAQKILVDRNQYSKSEEKFYALKAIALGRFEALYHYLDVYLSSSIVEHKKMAISASAFTLTKKYAMTLIGFLDNDMYKMTATDALKYYGESLINLSREMIDNENIKRSIKVRLVQTLSDIGTQNAVNYLSELLNHKSFKIRKATLTQLNLSKSKYPKLDYQKENTFRRINIEVQQVKKLFAIQYSLENFFKSGPESSESLFFKEKMKVLKRLRLLIKKRMVSIFLLLGLEYEKRDIFDIYTGIVSDDEIKRSYSLEFLEMMIEYKYSKVLAPVIEVVIKNELSETDVRNLKLARLQPQKALALLFKYPDQKMRNRILNLFAHREMSALRPILNSKLKNLSPLMEKKLQVTKERLDRDELIAEAN